MKSREIHSSLRSFRPFRGSGSRCHGGLYTGKVSVIDLLRCNHCKKAEKEIEDVINKQSNTLILDRIHKGLLLKPFTAETESGY